jgi:hypothetical protein
LDSFVDPAKQSTQTPLERALRAPIKFRHRRLNVAPCGTNVTVAELPYDDRLRCVIAQGNFLGQLMDSGRNA